MHQKSPFLLPYLDPFITSSYYKNTTSRSSLASPSIASNNDAVAILYKTLDIGSRLHSIKFYLKFV